MHDKRAFTTLVSMDNKRGKKVDLASIACHSGNKASYRDSAVSFQATMITSLDAMRKQASGAAGPGGRRRVAQKRHNCGKIWAAIGRGGHNYFCHGCASFLTHCNPEATLAANNNKSEKALFPVRARKRPAQGNRAIQRQDVFDSRSDARSVRVQKDSVASTARFHAA